MYICFFRSLSHLHESTASQGLDPESSIRETGSPHSTEAAALQLTPDISNKSVDVGTPDKNNSSSQTMHSSFSDIRFNPDIFTPGVWLSD